MPYPGLLHPEPLRQATAEPDLRRRHSNTQRQVWLSLWGFSWWAQGFVWAIWVSLVGMGLDSKWDLPLLPSCWGFSFAPGCGVSFIGGIQHSPVDGCSAASCNSGVFAGEERMSFCTANKQEYWRGLPLPFPEDNILLELTTIPGCGLSLCQLSSTQEDLKCCHSFKSKTTDTFTFVRTGIVDSVWFSVI